MELHLEVFQTLSQCLYHFVSITGVIFAQVSCNSNTLIPRVVK